MLCIMTDLNPNLRILILGNKGMLGNAVFQYLKKECGVEPKTILARFGDDNFIKEIKDLSPDYIINCIGIIPQRKPRDEEYKMINTDLPILLDSLGFKVIHPSTDCEFDGKIDNELSYKDTDTMNASDIYGISKANATQYIVQNGKNTKIIRTSIIGHEDGTNVSLLDWFLSQDKKTRGYTNHLWNGITTLEWAKQAINLMQNWDSYSTLTQIGTKEKYTKFDILNIAKSVYGKNIEILPFETEESVNKTLQPNIIAKDLKHQLEDLKKFYNK